jgi:hypothetical protein
MNRIKLSSNIVSKKITLIIAFGIYLVYLVSAFNPYALILLLVFVVFAYNLFYLPDNIEFDNEYMYIIYKDGETMINLKNIYYVSPVGSLINPSGLGKIKYRYEGSDYLAQFSLRYFSSSFKRFKEAVTEKNPRATIRGFTPYPFD